MPELIPVENDPFNPSVNLVPIDHDPFALQGDVGAAIQQQNAVEAQRRATAGGLLQHFMTPGRVAQGVQPETAGMMTEADAYRLNQLEDQAQSWAPQQAMNMIGTGVPMAQSGALGAAGGGIKALSDVRPAKENLADIVDANFIHGRVIGDQTVPIESLQGGVSQEVSDQKRVGKLVRSMNGPGGYIERPIVDDAGNVIEGQHRLDALRQLGATDVPVTVVKDLARGYDVNAMKKAISATAKLPSDHVNQLVRHALDAIHDEGSPTLAAANTSIGGQFETPYQAALAAAEPGGGKVITHSPTDITSEYLKLSELSEAAHRGEGIRAYHGSPYDFEKFDLGKIGTGEGAQSYGHGLYFAENPATAQDYKANLARPDFTQTRSGVPISSDMQRILEDAYNDAINVHGVKSPSENDAVHLAGQNLERQRQDALKAGDFDWYGKIADQQAELARMGKDAPATHGKMYEVNINADPEHFLDWDKPLSEQHPKVQEALKKFGYEGDATDLGEFAGQKVQGAPRTGEEIYNNMASKSAPAMDIATKQLREAAAKQLREAGIPGIKYLDQGSRRGLPSDIPALQEEVNQLQARVSRGETRFQADLDSAQRQLTIAQGQQKPTSNYVVFNDKLIDIIKKYGLAGLVAGGASHFTTTPVNHNPFAAQQ